MNFLINIHKKCLCILILCGFNVGVIMTIDPREQNAQKTVIEKMQEEQAKNDKNKEVPVEVIEKRTEPDQFVQTEAHLHIKKVRQAIQDNYSSKVIPYFNIISRAIVKERKLKDTHYVFYQGTRSEWSVPQDLYTQLYAYFHPGKNVEEFKFLRFKDESIKEHTAKDFLVNELQSNGLVDDNGMLGALLLSTNLALFGNVGFPGECTWDYFIGRTLSKRVPSVNDDYVPMLKNWGLSTEYLDEILALEDLVRTDEQILTQIFVPKDKVDTYAYLAWVRGIPAHEETVKWILDHVKTKSYEQHVKPTMVKLGEQFKNEQQKNELFKDLLDQVKNGDFSVDAFLKIYRNEPWELKFSRINYTTARLIFTPDFMLNPTSGLKFYRYSTASRDRLEEYSKKLEELVQKLVAGKGVNKEENSKKINTQFFEEGIKTQD